MCVRKDLPRSALLIKINENIYYAVLLGEGATSRRSNAETLKLQLSLGWVLGSQAEEKQILFNPTLSTFQFVYHAHCKGG